MTWICLAELVALAAFIYRKVMWPTPLRTGSGKTVIACVGDSITYSLGVLGRRRKWSYPALLARMMGAEYATVNYGLNDRTLLSTADKPYFREKVGKMAWDTDAEIVIFMLGSNDCKRKNWNAARFAAEYEAVIRHYRDEKQKTLLVMLPPRIFYAKPDKNGYDDAILRDELIPLARALAEKHGVLCVDLYQLTQDRPQWFPDRLHPNKDGNLAIAELVSAHLRQL